MAAAMAGAGGTVTARVLDGKAIAEAARCALTAPVAALSARLGRPPGLGVLLVGEDPGSQVYVRNKERAATLAGMVSKVVRLPASASQADIEAAVDEFNRDPTVDGFLVQLPLPPGIDAERVTRSIRPDKDADGLHPTNLGCLIAGASAPRPCTPWGVMKLLDHTGVDLAGARAVVVGRSAIVGKPQALMLLERHATVTLCHSKTRDLPAEVGRADVVVAAVGRPALIRGEWLKPGAVVIDVGINRVDGKLVGDVEFETARERAAWITPVPGGVGPMTIAMLLENTLALARARLTGGQDGGEFPRK